MSLFEMSIAGSILILWIVVARALVIHRLPKVTFLVLWVMAALRLLLPFSIPLPSRMQLVAPTSTVQNMVEHFIPSSSDIAAVSSESVSIWMILWLCGVLLIALWFTISYIRCMQVFRMSIPDNSPYIKKWLITHRIFRSMEVRISDRIASPLTYGILHPVILLPKHLDREDEVALQYILAHEYLHIRRLDAVTKLLFAAVLCIHWYNPLVWVMYLLANRDLELSCDAWVVRTMGESNRSSYARMLLDLEESRSHCVTFCSHFSKTAIVERIEAIMKCKKTTATACLLASLLVVGATTAFATASDAGKEYHLSDLHLVEGTVGTEFSGMKIIDQQVTYDNLGDLNLVEDISNAAANQTEVVDLTSLPHDAVSDLGDNVQEMDVTLISVSHDDASKFTPEEWDEILKQIEDGTISWED